MSANPRPSACRVAILGFSDFERASLASCLRLSGQRSPAYVESASAATCDCLIVDADAPDAVAQALGARRAADAVFIGAVPPKAATAGLLRQASTPGPSAGPSRRRLTVTPPSRSAAR